MGARHPEYRDPGQLGMTDCIFPSSQGHLLTELDSISLPILSAQYHTLSIPQA